ncbi:MAG: Bro-N domain-containing protein [Patescibacteria group bacterium]
MSPILTFGSVEHQNNKIVLFQSRFIRRVWYQKEWYFSVIDIVTALTETPSPRQYWSVLKAREPQLLTICLQLKLESADKKFYLTDCVNTKNAFRLIQSIPSPKAEPFKMWLAQVGKERNVAGNARKETEKEINASVISKQNFLGKKVLK